MPNSDECGEKSGSSQPSLTFTIFDLPISTDVQFCLSTLKQLELKSRALDLHLTHQFHLSFPSLTQEERKIILLVYKGG